MKLANDIKNSIVARVENAAVTGARVAVGATEDATIYNVTAAGAGAGTFALGGSMSANLIRDTADAHVSVGSRSWLFCSFCGTGQSWAQPRPARSLEYVSQACNPAPSEGPGSAREPRQMWQAD